MLRATGSAAVAALLLSCGTAPQAPPPLGWQCLLGHPPAGDVDGELRRIDLHARQLGLAWPARCGVARLYDGERIAPAVHAAMQESAVSTEPPPAPLALPDAGDALPAVFDDVVDDALHAGTHTCRLQGDALHCWRTRDGALVPRWLPGPPVLRDDGALVPRRPSGPLVLGDDRALYDARTGAVLAHGDQVSLGDEAYAIRGGEVFRGEQRVAAAPPGAVLVRDRVVWWDEGTAQLMARTGGGGAAVAIGGMDRGASAPDARQTCAGPEVAAVRLVVGGRIAVWTAGGWQIYEAPGGPLWCHGPTVTTISPSGERQDCTAGGCPTPGGKVHAPAGAVVAPLGGGVIAAWVGGRDGAADEEVRVELPSHQQIIAFDGYRTTRTFARQLRVDRVGVYPVGDAALLLLHGERELAVKVAADGTLTALRVIAE